MLSVYCLCVCTCAHFKVWTNRSQTFWSQEAFTFLKIIKDPNQGVPKKTPETSTTHFISVKVMISSSHVLQPLENAIAHLWENESEANE